MNSTALESFTFWTGIATVGFALVGALCGGLYVWFSSKINSLKEEMNLAEESRTISHLQQPAVWTGKISVGLTAAGAFFGCLYWWFSFTVSDMKQEARLHFEREYTAKMKMAESEVSKAREEATKALADVAAANERTGRLEAKAAGFRERAARAEYMIQAAEAQLEEAKKEAAQASEGTAKALAETAVTKERASRLEVEAAALRERAVQAEASL